MNRDRLRLVERLGDQLHVGDINPKEAEYTPIVNRECFPKPAGGLWTSTSSKKEGSDWVRYCMTDYTDALKPTGWLCKVNENTKITEIDSQEDLKDTIEHYRHPCQFGFPKDFTQDRDTIDFEKLSKDYDAIHLTEAGQWRTRLPLSGPNLYGWDAESTLHFKDNFKDCRKVDLTKFCEKAKKHEAELEVDK